jgi:hypothetical protein
MRFKVKSRSGSGTAFTYVVEAATFHLVRPGAVASYVGVCVFFPFRDSGCTTQKEARTQERKAAHVPDLSVALVFCCFLFFLSGSKWRRAELGLLSPCPVSMDAQPLGLARMCPVPISVCISRSGSRDLDPWGLGHELQNTAEHK